MLVLPQAIEFDWVDTAFGGVDRRNNIMRLREFRERMGSLNGTPDCFATVLRFPNSFEEYVRSNRSVAKYPGAAFAPCVWFDFDCEEDPGRALADARTLVLRLKDQYGVPLDLLGIHFSGCKGFAIEIPAVMFGGIPPGDRVADQIKRIALLLGRGLETLDGNVYDKLRLWRVPNTLNGKSGLYKIPLRVEEFLNLPLVEIRELARSPRRIESDEGGGSTPCPALVAIRDSTRGLFSLAANSSLRPTQRIPQGQRNRELASLAGTMRRRGMSESEIRAALTTVNDERCDPPLADEEVRRVAESISRYPAGAQPGTPDRDAVPDEDDGVDPPQIDAGEGDLRRLGEATWGAIREANDPPWIFRQGTVLVRIERDDSGTPMTKILDKGRLRYHLAQIARWTRMKKDEDLDVPPPAAAVDYVLSTPDPELPILNRIVQAPVMAPDGSIRTEPGYDPPSRCYLAPARGLNVSPVAEAPSGEEIRVARELLLELVNDFPFVSDADRAHAIALLLLPFVRALVDGPTPLHLIEKPRPGTGATLLVEVLLYPALGKAIAAMTEGRSEDEWRKRLTAKLLTAPPALFIDNVRSRLDSAALAAAITCRSWEDRVLGVSEMARIDVACAWVATGNNPSVSNEVARRTIRLRLDAKQDRPWERKPGSFLHPDLLNWVRESRGQLIWAALALGRAWVMRGRPRGRMTPLGMFEGWCEVMGGILAVAEIDGFLGNREDFYEAADTESAAWRAFVVRWWERFGNQEVGVRELYELVAEGDEGIDLGTGSERSQRTRLGHLLRAHRDWRYERFVIVMGGTRQGAQQWKIVENAET